MTGAELVDDLEDMLRWGEEPDDLDGLWEAAGEAYIEEGGHSDPTFLRLSELLDHFQMKAQARA